MGRNSGIEVLLLKKLHTKDFDENWIIIADRFVELIYWEKKDRSFIHWGVIVDLIMTMLEAVVTLLWKHWADLNSVQNLIYYLKIITKLKKKLVSHD